MVSRIEGDGEFEGVRGGTDMLVQVDAAKYIADGGHTLWSQTGVLLCQGPIGPEYIIGIVDRGSGRPVTGLPVPSLTNT